MSHYFLCSQNKHSKNLRFFQYVFSDLVAANFFKKESRSPRGFLPRPLLRAGETIAPPPYPQKNSGGAHQQFRSKKVRANARITPPYLDSNQGPQRYIYRYRNITRIKCSGVWACLDSNQGPQRYKLCALTN